MTNTAHTPGPWVWKEYQGNKDDLSPIWTVEMSQGCGLLSWDGDAETINANARLIAAAPDLLDYHVRIDDALTFALENGDMPANVRHSVTCARDIARAAIAKAKGGAE